MPVTVQAVGLSILLAATALTTIPEQSPLPDRCQVKQQLVGRSNAETDGPKVVIDTVDFDRPSQIPRAERDELVESLKHTQFSEAPGWLEQIEEVPVRGFWQDRGYFKAVVKAEAQPTAPTQKANISRWFSM